PARPRSAPLRAIGVPQPPLRAAPRAASSTRARPEHSRQVYLMQRHLLSRPQKAWTSRRSAVLKKSALRLVVAYRRPHWAPATPKLPTRRQNAQGLRQDLSEGPGLPRHRPPPAKPLDRDPGSARRSFL